MYYFQVKSRLWLTRNIWLTDLKVRGSNPSLGKELFVEGVADMRYHDPFNFCKCYKCALLL